MQCTFKVAEFLREEVVHWGLCISLVVGPLLFPVLVPPKPSALIIANVAWNINLSAT
jgi:hypothetical protein